MELSSFKEEEKLMKKMKAPILAGEYTKEKNYWLNKLSGGWKKGCFPCIDNRMGVNKGELRQITFSFRGELHAGLTKLSSGSDINLHMILAAGLLALLHRYMGTGGNDDRRDITVAVPIYRQTVEAEFVNTILVLRNRLESSLTFKELLLQVRETIIEADENLNYPVERLAGKLKIDSGEAASPLFDIVILLENIHDKSYIRDVFPNMIFSFLRTDQLVEGVVEYNSAMYRQSTVERITRHFQNLLQKVLETITLAIGSIDLLTGEEKKLLLTDFNNSFADYPQDKTLHRLFREQAAKTSDCTAVTGIEKGNRHTVITYHWLNRKSDDLARVLRKKGIKEETVVGLMVDRSPEMVVGMLAVLKAGGAFLPVSSLDPLRRKTFILKDSGAAMVLTQKKLLQQAPRALEEFYPGNIFLLDDEKILSSEIEGPGMGGEIIDKPAPRDYPNHLVYTIYTAGNTGSPKGVSIEHSALVNFIYWMYAGYKGDFGPKDTCLSLADASFDVSIGELFLPLEFGSALVLSTDERLADPRELSAAIVKEAITFAFIPAILLREVGTHLESRSKGSNNVRLALNKLLVGGGPVEAGDFHRFNQLNSRMQIIYGYGQAETTICAAACKFNAVLHRHKEDRIPAGKPLANTQIMITNPHGQLNPPGIGGELCISGAGLARGYINRPELTADQFAANGFNGGKNKRNKRMFKTRECGRWQANGNIEILGSLDRRIDTRGYRIDPGEIEGHLRAHKAIKEALVIDLETDHQAKYLCAYLVYHASEKDEQGVSQWVEFLSGSLPAYMIPQYFVRIESIPLDPMGLVDRNFLPAPQEMQRGKKNFVAPRAKLEKEIAEIWKTILKKESVGIYDNFFEIGGNSLGILKLKSLLKGKMGLDIPDIKFLEYPTIGTFYGYLQQEILSVKENREGQGDRGDGDAVLLAPLPQDGREMRGEEAVEKGEKPWGMEIAVIGMSCRFPNARNIDEFRDNLLNGMESISFFADEELEESGEEAVLSNDPNYVRAKAVLEDIEYFDTSFFGYTPLEVELMDPQVRMFHVCVWEALEDAGYVPGYDKCKTGVYAGSGSHLGWEVLSILSGKSDTLGSFSAWQLYDKDFMSTRVSYNLDLSGPSINVQTACSTSLVAIHLACQGLRQGECSLAVAGGSKVLIPSRQGYLYQEGMIVSEDGHCRAFDARAHGTSFGEGAGVVVLKALEQARADRDFIYAVVKGSAINNDGRGKVGYTAPGIKGQAEVIRQAQRQGRINPENITYVETHGTGTDLGDPAEIEALTQAFNTKKRGFCRIGSVKSNIGHLDTAAGVAGFIKTVLALKHGVIPPSLHFEKQNSKIPFADTPFIVNTEIYQWQTTGHPRQAGVSSFGVGGTNAHVILEEAPALPPLESKSRENQLIVLSAKTETLLEVMAGNLATHLEKHPGIDLADVAYTLQVGRKAFKHRWISVFRGIPEAVETLSTQEGARRYGYRGTGSRRSVVFMFPGQGSQYVEMGRDLYEKEAVFREEMDRCFGILKPLLGDEIKEIIYPRGGTGVKIGKADKDQGAAAVEEMNRTAVVQPLLFAFEYALAMLLRQWGIEPVAMIGHSIGEYTAACLSGVFSLEDGLEIAALRGRLMQQMPGGAMLSVSIGQEDLSPLLPGDISLAAVNSPSHCVVSGPYEAIEKFSAQLKKQGHETRRLHTSHAFHSPMMDPILEEFKRKIAGRRLSKPRIPYISNLTGNWITGEESSDPGYWAAHLRRSVQFAAGLTELLKQEENVLVEVGPGNALSTFTRQHPGKKNGHVVSELVRHPRADVSDQYFLLEQMGRLWLCGVEINWAGFYGDEKRNRLPLPSYPFANQYYPIKGNPFTMGIEPLRQKPRLLEKNKDISRWFYLPLWEETDLPVFKAGEGPGSEPLNWLVFLDGHGLGKRLTGKLEEAGQEVAVVKVGTGYDESREGEFTLNPGIEDHYRELFATLGRRGKIPRKIIHLWGITGNEQEEQGWEIQGGAVDRLLDRVFYSLLYIAIGSQEITSEIRLGVLVDHMQEVLGSEELNPVKAVSIGAVQTISREYPHLRCDSLDVIVPGTAGGRGREEKLVENLLAELTRPWSYSENIIAYRGNHRWVQKVKSAPFEKPGENTPCLREKGAYLVTGGTGGIGLTLARHLAKEVKARLVLTGRSWFPAREEWDRWLSTHGENDPIGRKIKKLAKILEWGGEVEVVSADAADPGQMQEVAALMRERYGCINGVIHASGVPDGALIQRRTRQMTESVLAPKVRGALVLNYLLKDEPLDFFILCSSLSSILVPVGQAAYSGANAFLDAFARYKTAKDGTFCVSINWDTWQEVGMAVDTVKKRESSAEREKNEPAGPLVEVKHPLFRHRVRKNAREVIYVSHFRVDNHWVLDEHRLLGKPTLPGTALVEMARAAYEDHMGTQGMKIHDLYFLAPLRMEENEEREVHTILKEHESGEGFKFIIRSRLEGQEDRWVDHAAGAVSRREAGVIRRHDIEELAAKCDKSEIIVTQEMLTPRKGKDELNFIFGPRWENVRKVNFGENEVLVTLELREEFSGDIGVYKLHPALLDTAVGYYNTDDRDKEASLPFSYKKIDLIKPMSRKLYCYHRYKEVGRNDDKIINYNIIIMDEEGTESVVVEDYQRLIVSQDAKAKLSEGGVLPPVEAREIPGFSPEAKEEKPLEYLEHGLLPGEGIEVLARVLGRRAPQVVISTRDLAGLLEFYNASDMPGFAREVEAEKPRQGALRQRPEMNKAYVAPAGRIEQKIAEIWQDFLGIDKIGSHDDFFELGGDSLKAMTITQKIHQALEIEIPLRKFFSNPTISGISANLANTQKTESPGVEPLEKQEYFRVSIEPVEEKEYYPLSSAQKRLYFLQQLDLNSTAYNMTIVVPLGQGIKKDKLEAALKRLIARHESLRTSIERVKEDVVQRIHPAESTGFSLDYYEAGQTGIEEIIKGYVRPFDLSRVPLIRSGLISLPGGKYVWMLDIHHIVSDGTSNTILSEEFMQLYGTGAPLEPLPVRYKDFTQWQNRLFAGGWVKGQEDYWLRLYAGEIPRLNLATDYKRPGVFTFEGGNHMFRLEKEDAVKFKTLGVQYGGTLYMNMLAALNTLFYKYTGQNDIIIGSGIAGRRHADIQGVVGMFVNTLPMRNYPAGEKSYENFLKEVIVNSVKGFENQDVLFKELVEKLDPERDPSRNPLFDISLVVRNLRKVEPGISLQEVLVVEENSPVIEYKNPTSKFDLTFSVVEQGDDVIINIEYYTGIFRQETILRLESHFNNVVKTVIEEPGIKLKEITIISEEEKREVLYEFNDTAREYPRDKSIPGLFEEQVEQAPDRIALVGADSGGGPVGLTYRELNERSNRWANYLMALGVGAETIVGICAERTLEMLIGLLGILKAEGAYLPLDPDYPQTRLQFMLEDSGAGVLLSQRHLLERLPVSTAKAIGLESEWKNIAGYPGENYVRQNGQNGPGDLAYVIYTSGSTGKPKGVGIPHTAVIRLVRNTNYIQVGTGDCIALVSNISFDAATFELWASLLNGAKLVCIPREVVLSPHKLAMHLRIHRIDTLSLTTSVFNLMAQRQPGSFSTLKTLMFGAEKVDPYWVGIVLAHNPPKNLLHMYGPTESTTFATWYPVKEAKLNAEMHTIPIGKPIANTRIYILDAQHQLQPLGIPGELCIAGSGLARGYLNRPELTAEKFCLRRPGALFEKTAPGPRKNFLLKGSEKDHMQSCNHAAIHLAPHHSHHSTTHHSPLTIYRTGDLARWHPDGNLEFLGRIDHQIKLRGIRIELGEIETALRRHEAVKEAVVVLYKKEDNTRLAAYVTLDIPLEDAAGVLRSWLKTRLPEYMVPASFTVLERLPLTPNGKIDRKALPAPDWSIQVEQQVPRTETERLLCSIWSQVLGIEITSILSHFFVAGGHSLLATRLVSRIRGSFGIEMPLRVIFEQAILKEQAEWLDKQQRGPGLPPIMPLAEGTPLVLSFAQQRLWFLAQLEGQSAAYNMPAALHLEGKLDETALQHALTALIQRHDSLRQCFPVKDGKAAVKFIDVYNPLSITDLSELSKTEQQHQVREWIDRHAQTPFDLGTGPLLSLRLLKLGKEEQVLLFNMHHIIGDGWSMGVLIREWSLLYNAHCNNVGVQNLEPLPIQYTDYAAWQRNWLQGEILEKQLAYWTDKLKGAPGLLELPTDYPRPAVMSYRGKHLQSTLDQELTQGIKQLSRQQGVTDFMTLLAVFKVLLYRYSGQTDLVVGSPIANRTHQQTEDLIGFFVNTLVLRTQIHGEQTPGELLKQVRQTALEAYSHQDIPFEYLVEKVNPSRSLGHSPLFQAMFALQNAPGESLELSGIKMSFLEPEYTTAKFDLTLSAVEMDGVFVFDWEYCTDLFRPGTIARMAEHFQVLLGGILDKPGQPLCQLPLLTEAGKEQLQAWSQTEADYPGDQTIVDLFQVQVEKTPDQIAVVFEEQVISYRELNTRANQLAHYLMALGVEAETLVGICAERSLEMAIGLLGILKAGGTYLPLDPDYPLSRLQLMLEDSGAAVLLSQSHLTERLPVSTAKAVGLENEWKKIAGYPGENPVRQSGPGNSAYVIYTSGSTGKPKGVLVGHAAIAQHIHYSIRRYRIEPNDNVMQFASLNFDASIEQIFSTWCGGARLILLRTNLLQAKALQNIIAKEQITIANLPPTYWQQLLQEVNKRYLETLKLLILGGDALSSLLAQQTRQTLPGNITLLNAYGPTEAAITSTLFEITEQFLSNNSGKVTPIGKPIANTQIYILDTHHNPTPPGIPGELCIAGSGLARGYLNRPELTAEKFCLRRPGTFLLMARKSVLKKQSFPRYPGNHGNPRRTNQCAGRWPVGPSWVGAASPTIYKTGDLARWHPDGNLEFLGRIDHQIKLRGFRIELGEIETTLSRHEAVKESAVTIYEKGDNPRLVAYITLDTPLEDAAGVLRSWLKTRLPEYMVPASFTVLERLPLTPNGKIDRKALPAPNSSALTGIYAAPRTDTEQRMVEAWNQVLKQTDIGILDNFFERGGDSLLCIQIVARARALGLELNPRDLFQHQTIAELARVVRTTAAFIAEQGLVTGEVPLIPIQQAFFDRQLKEPWHFNQAILLTVPAEIDEAALKKAMAMILQHHDALRLRYRRIHDRWQQWCDVESTGELPFHIENLGHLSKELQEQALRERSDFWQASLNLETGPLVRLVLFHLGNGSRLLWCIHHLAVDGVSWRILLEDLQTAFHQAAAGQPICLPAKTSSFKAWAEKLIQWKDSKSFAAQAGYWQRLPEATPLPMDNPSGSSRIVDGQHYTIHLSPNTTQRLLTGVSAPYQTRINDFLLTALMLALREWTGETRHLIDLESHGRADMFEEIDLSRTVGWFTALHTIYLALPDTGDLGDCLQSIREQLRQIPHNGVGCGVMRYLKGDKLPEGQILFNYLGQFDQSVQDSPFSLAGESSGTSRGLEGEQEHLIEINGHMIEGQLNLTFSFSRDQYEFATIRQLADTYQFQLQRLIEHVQNQYQQQLDLGTLLPLQSRRGSDSRLPLFCLPGVGGKAGYFRQLAISLGIGQPVYGLESPGLDGHTDIPATVEALANHNIKVMRHVQPSGPYHLVGHSFGGIIALEMALQLEQQGTPVGLLAILDRPAPKYRYQEKQVEQTEIDWIWDIVETLKVFLGITPPVTLETLKSSNNPQYCYQILMNWLKSHHAHETLFTAEGKPEEIRALVQVCKANTLAFSRYRPAQVRVQCPIDLFYADESQGIMDNHEAMPEYWGWAEHTRASVRKHRVPGAHITMLLNPHVKTLAAQLHNLLSEEISRQGPPAHPG